MTSIDRSWCSLACLLALSGTLIACSSHSDESGVAGPGEVAGFTSTGGAGVGGSAIDHAGGGAGAAAGSNNAIAGVGGSAEPGAAGAGTGLAGAIDSGGRNGNAGSAGALTGGSGGSGQTSCEAPLVSGKVANLVASEQVDTYAIMGSSASALRNSINANRGHEYDAQTDWSIQWSVKNCATPAWTVSLSIDYSMPNWDVPAGADPVLVAQWRTYVSALYCHEYGHGKIGLDCANRIYDDFAGLPGNADCNALTSAAKARFQAILNDCHTIETDYDTQTNHGATMGAIFPP